MGVPFALPDVGEREIQAVLDALRAGWITSGPGMRAFEAEFEAWVAGAPGATDQREVRAVAVSSATMGLLLALEACGVGSGDEVIVPTWTFTATAEVVAQLGARPVLVDVDPRTLNVTPDAVVAAITPRTKAVIPVHIAGLALDVRALRDALPAHIRIIEDAAHALPATCNGQTVGTCSASDAAVFSFYSTKTMTTGEGGMVTTADESLARRMRIMRLHGIDRDMFDRYQSTVAKWRYDVVGAGFKGNMTDIAAAIGRVQLMRLEEMRLRRAAVAESYLRAFSSIDALELPALPFEGDVHAWHLFIVRVSPDVDRDAVIDAMYRREVGASVHFIPLHLLSHWRESLGTSPADLPVASREFERVISLPVYSRMSDSDVELVIDAVAESLRECAS